MLGRLCELGTSPSQQPVGSQCVTWALPRLCLSLPLFVVFSCPARQLFYTESCDQLCKTYIRVMDDVSVTPARACCSRLTDHGIVNVCILEVSDCWSGVPIELVSEPSCL